MVFGTKHVQYGTLPLEVDGAPPRTSFVVDESAGGVLRVETPVSTAGEQQAGPGVFRSADAAAAGWRRRAALLAAAAGMACLLAGGAAVLVSSAGRSASSMRGADSTSTNEAALVSSDPHRVMEMREELRQPEIRESEGGLLETTFRIMPTLVDVGPITFMTRAYEGVVPGPVLRVKPGDVLRINQVNKLGPEAPDSRLIEHAFQLPNTTTIHTHGLHISPAGIEDNIFRVLRSGEEAISEYHIRHDHQRKKKKNKTSTKHTMTRHGGFKDGDHEEAAAGTFYYHPHYHGSSTIQQAGGMSGALIVADDPSSLPEELRGVRDLVLMLQHLNMQDGTFSNYVFASAALHSGLKPEVTYKSEDSPGNFYIVNGQYQPKITLQPGELVRLRLINGGVSNYLLMHVPGCELFTIAADGVFLPKPRRQRLGLVIPLGSRKDVLLRCPQPGLFVADSSRQDPADQTMISEFLGTHTNFYEGTLFHVHSTGLPLDAAVPSWLPAPRAPLHPQFADLRGLAPNQHVVNRFDYEFLVGPKVPRGGYMYTWYGVNGHLMPITTSQRTVQLGDVEEWRISVRRKDGYLEETQHPWHMHVNHVQVLNMSHGHGYDYEVGDWRDSISLPTVNWPKHREAWVVVRWRANDFTGMSVSHCHIFPHADTGMTLTFEIVDKKKTEEEGQQQPEEEP